jgi:hypothetical protein
MPDSSEKIGEPRLKRAFYSATIAQFLVQCDSEILGALTLASEFAVEPSQRDAWLEQITILRAALTGLDGWVSFEYVVPRVGRRIDVLAVIESVVFVLEFKVGEDRFASDAVNQVWDYALDLKNFHSTTHDRPVAPVLIATGARSCPVVPVMDSDGVLRPICAAPEQIPDVIARVLAKCGGPPIDIEHWTAGRYAPTPTIIEAAMALYGRHEVEEITRHDAAAINLTETSDCVSTVIQRAGRERRKVICFVTGVPGAGKTLVGLNTATRHSDSKERTGSVFLSGNGPLVSVLREALARDKVRRESERGQKCALGDARSEVKAFIQNVHHFRDEYLRDAMRPPFEHVALFDEAQRAWDKKQTAAFMLRKKKVANFESSEPEFLISCMDRHKDWAVIVCLVGGGQEINTGEAGISEWLDALERSFPAWEICLSPHITDSEYAAGRAVERLRDRPGVFFDEALHLSVSMRSFRAEHVSTLVKQVLDLDTNGAERSLAAIAGRYPIVLTRDLREAKQWLRTRARGNDRYGIVVSSGAQRLKPHAIDVRVATDPIHWFLDPREDVRSSYYLEDVATEFQVQGLELDWTCVVWDGDFRRSDTGWEHWSFRGDHWQRVRSAERQAYLKNAYRVLLTRARQGMVVVVPKGEEQDPTRAPEYYDPTFDFLRRIGLPVLK